MSGLSLTKRALAFGAAMFTFVVFAQSALGQNISEGFDTVSSNTGTPLPGWVSINNSSPPGSTQWFQGNPDVFASHMGEPNSYIGANFNATQATNTISLWLISPQRTYNNGDVVKFWTRTVEKSLYPDRLQVRLSTNGNSTNVGGTATSVGDFTNLLLDINPALEPGGYPELWTEETITISGLGGPTNGRLAFRYFVTDGGPTGANSNYFGIDTLTIGSGAAPADHQESDYNGDGKTDFSVVRNTGGGATGQVTWFNAINGGGTTYAPAWGIATDFFVPGDYDGDNKTDVAIWRPGAPGAAEWYILNTMSGTVSRYVFGQSGDDPTVQGDWDGDGKTDIAVYRGGAAAGQQSYFYYRGSLNNPSGNITYIPWGQNGDFPFSGDFDGDNMADAAVQRGVAGGQGRFFIRHATGSTDSFIYGTSSDVISPGDYDGDGKTDVMVSRSIGGSITWFLRPSSNPGSAGAGAFAVFGLSATDFRAQGDYDGDGKTDVAVWRPNADPNMTYFYYLGSTSGFGAYEWGQNGDYPVTNWNSH